MITVMFRCIGKSSRETDAGIIWTITLVRGKGGPPLTTKIKTLNRAKAESYIEGKEYPITLLGDDELGGLFAQAPAPPDVDQETGEVLRRVK